MSFNTDYKTIKYNYGNQSSIFQPGEHYGVATKVSDFWINKNIIYFEIGLNDLMKGTISIEFFENDSFRMKFFRYGENNRFEEHLQFPNKVSVKVSKKNDHYIIPFNDYKIEIHTKEFDIKVFKGEKKIFSLYKRLGYEFFGKYLSPPLGFKTIEKHNVFPFISFDLENDENIYGLGEKFKSVEKRGVKSETLSQSTNIVNTTDISYNSIPLIYSTNGWGLFVNTGFKTHFEVGSYATDALSIMPEENCLDLFIMLDPQIKGLQKKYTDFTGRISDIPTKAYGVIVSRLYYNNKEEALNEIKAAKEKDFPIDIIGIDPKWIKRRYSKTCNFTINDEAFGDIKEFSDIVKKDGVEVSLWLNTNVQGDDSDYFKTCVEKNYLAKDIKGNLTNALIGPALKQGSSYVIDFTNPEAYQFYKNQIKSLIKQGINFFTPDYGGGVSPDSILHNGKSGKEMKNFSQWLYPKAVFEAMEEELGKGKAILYRRPGYLGTHKFAGKWGGDSFTRFQELQNQIRAGLSNSICSEFMWGMDLGGGYRGKPQEELTIRWNQAGALFPHTRFHGIGKREPWYTSEKATENAKKYLLLKRRLLPYYKHFEAEAQEKGTPFIRALVLEFQNDIFARKIEDQFMLGDKIMVTPILNNKQRSRQVYFPMGVDWIDFESKEVYKGGQVAIINAPLEKLPIFVKSGSKIPMFDSKLGNYNLDKADQQKIDLYDFGSENLDIDNKYNIKINSKQIIL